MGRHNVDQGVKDQYGDTVGEALIWRLGEDLKDDFIELQKLPRLMPMPWPSI